MSIKQFYCTGLVIPLSTSSMSMVLSILFMNTISILLFVCVYVTTYAFYATDSIVGIEVDKVSHPEGSQFLRKHRTVMCVTILLAIVASISISALVSPLIVLLVAISPVIALMYSGVNIIERIPNSSKKSPFYSNKVLNASSIAF